MMGKFRVVVGCTNRMASQRENCSASRRLYWIYDVDDFFFFLVVSAFFLYVLPAPFLSFLVPFFADANRAWITGWKAAGMVCGRIDGLAEMYNLLN